MSSTSASQPTLRWEPPAPEVLQAALPQYQVTALLGRGGMGAVYLGRQISLDREVAIKILPQHLEGGDGSFVERFKNEARAMAKLNHPGIVAVYDFGQTDAGLLYFVMEFVEGTDVQRMISKQRQLQPAHAQAITAHVCDALAYAHERGLIHRDIKPANIMLSRDGAVKVADFGLAKAVNTNATNLTQSGMVLGTLHYMAPESFILGAAVDHRADIYAVGVMLYQMLTGRLPSGVFELPSLQIPGLNPRFDHIITRALREEREQRYQSAVEMRRDLDDVFTQPAPVKETPPAAAPAIHRTATKTLPQATRPRALPATPPNRPRLKPAKKTTEWGWGLATLVLIAGIGVYLWRSGVRVTFDATATPEPVAETTTAAPPSAPTTTVKPPDLATSAVPAAPKTQMAATTLLLASATLDFAEYQQLKAEHAATWQQHVLQPYDDGMALLKSRFVQALERAQSSSGKQVASVFAEELRRFKAAGQQPPVSDDTAASLPAQIPQFRQTYRAEETRLQQTRDLAAAGVTKEFLDALAALEKKQTASQQPGRAAGVKALQADLLAGKKAMAEVLGSTKTVTAAKPAVTALAAQIARPDGTLKTGGRLMFEENFDSGVLSSDWTQQGKAWYCVTGLLGTSEAYLKDTQDKGWGCWLRRELPEYARIEFDINLVGRGAVMVCELYATPTQGATSPAGTGYKLMFGEKGTARPVIQRGMTSLTSGGVNTNPVTARAGRTHHIVVQRVDGQTLEWFIDGSLHARARDGDPKRGGWLGFQYEDGMVLVDHVRVFDLDPRSQAVAPVTPAAARPVK
jgi:predicted Ser/Thr protein kinase